MMVRARRIRRLLEDGEEPDGDAGPTRRSAVQ
jgi:hypothetical protein